MDSSSLTIHDSKAPNGTSCESQERFVAFDHSDDDLATSPTRMKMMFSYDWAKGYVSPFRPSSSSKIALVFSIIGPSHKDVVMDLGCGDGRVLIHVSKEYGCKGIGIELDEALVKKAEDDAKEERVADLLQFQKKDFMTEDVMNNNLSNGNSSPDLDHHDSSLIFSILYLYLLPAALEKLKDKLLTQLQRGVTVICMGWPVEGWSSYLFQKEVTKGQGFYIYKRS